MKFNFKMSKGIGIERLLPPHVGPDCIDLLYKLLQMDPKKRITAEEALRHEFFEECFEIPVSLSPERVLKPKKRINNKIYGTVRLDVRFEGRVNQSDEEI